VGCIQKEEKIFKILEHEQIIIPVKKMILEHKKLKQHKDAVYHAINSGSEIDIKNALKNNVPVILKELRLHMTDEDEVLYRITSELFTTEELKELDNSI